MLELCFPRNKWASEKNSKKFGEEDFGKRWHGSEQSRHHQSKPFKFPEPALLCSPEKQVHRCFGKEHPGMKETLVTKAGYHTTLGNWTYSKADIIFDCVKQIC